MEKVKAGLRGMSAEEKYSHGQGVLDAMSGNPNFPNPEPPLAELESAITELGGANTAALDRGRLACARKRAAVSVFDRIMSRLAAYVNSVCAGDPVKLQSSGFHLSKRGEPFSELEAPAGLESFHQQFPGRAGLRWPRVAGALVYVVEMASLDGATADDWKRIGITSKLKFIATGIPPGAERCFRVCAIGARTQGPYCAPKGIKAAA